MAKQQALNDNFNTNSLSALWNAPGQLGSAVVSNINKRIEIAMPASSTATTDGFIASATTYDLSGSYAFVQVLQVAATATLADTIFWLKLDTNNWVRWIEEGGTLTAQKMIGGVRTNVFSTAYISGTHQWWKIWESGGTIFFDTSPDGITWTNRGTTTVSFAITGLQTTLEAACFQNETNPGTVIYDNFNTPGVIITGNPKTYTYHSYKNGAFQGTFNDVISDFSYQQEINSAGSTITIVRAVAADSYGEGTLVDFNNQIIVYEIDDANPNGSVIFQGFIVNYQPVFTDTNQEQVVLTVMGYGMTLSDYVLESAVTTDVNQGSQTGNTSQANAPSVSGAFTNVVQSFTIGAGITKLSAIEFWLAAPSSKFDIGNTILCQIFSAQADAESGGLTSLIASATLSLTSATGQAYRFIFAAAPTVTSGNIYWARIGVSQSATPGTPGNVNVFYDNTSPYPGGILETVSFDGVSTYTKASVSGDAYIKTFTTAGNTLFSFNSLDPSAILQSIMDNFAAQGGRISYNSSTIDQTNTTVTYTFNANTIYDAVNKVLTLAPVGWYWYIDQATNLLHFHKVSSTAQHKFTIGKNIKNLSIEKRAQDLVNVVYFTGGPTANVNLFNKYLLQSSIDLYGRHAIVYSDNNVTLSATAQIIANNILSTYGQVELRISLDILDDGGQANSALGFDIESVVLGESVSFRSFGPGTGGTLWDVAKWDQAKWDFDVTDISSVVVQVTRLDYKPDYLSLVLSTIPPDITKRIQDIYRNLQQANVLLNPATPS